MCHPRITQAVSVSCYFGRVFLFNAWNFYFVLSIQPELLWIGYTFKINNAHYPWFLMLSRRFRSSCVPQIRCACVCIGWAIFVEWQRCFCAELMHTLDIVFGLRESGSVFWGDALFMRYIAGSCLSWYVYRDSSSVTTGGRDLNALLQADILSRVAVYFDWLVWSTLPPSNDLLDQFVHHSVIIQLRRKDV